jgi:hypothetical protein
MSAVPGFTATSPLFPPPGCPKIADAPAGSPVTFNVTAPVELLRVILAVTLPIDPPAGTVTEALAN